MTGSLLRESVSRHQRRKRSQILIPVLIIIVLIIIVLIIIVMIIIVMINDTS
ncbi:hypothetical protein F5X96DRAFT_670355 [Biscogniauxia mediterranea]|nr:hypothetical protein F5X96DRAFT_670355 [Biscogniauxia mediterranea]